MATRITTHPGEMLQEEFLAPLGMSARALAAALDVPVTRVTELIRERRGVTADTAIRLGMYFGTTPDFWLNLQAAYDLSVARNAATDHRYRKIKRHPQAA